MKSSRDTTMHFSDCDRVLVIMAKAPRPGAVKTRLAESLSPESVLAFYRCLLDDTLSLARSLRDVELAIMCPESDVDELAKLAGNGISVVAQNGEGLAAGLISVFSVFAQGKRAQGQQAHSQRSKDDSRRIIAFNSDSPHLPRAVLEDAFEILATNDVVIGPTNDGGYYLVGAKSSYPALFANDGMGTSSALERLLARTRTLELSVGLTPSFYDIDVADDLTRLAEELRIAPERAPQTARWLQEWKSAPERSQAPASSSSSSRKFPGEL